MRVTAVAVTTEDAHLRVLHLDIQCYTWSIPTARPRHFVTESDELANAIDRASEWWPELSRPQLIIRLALEGVATADRRREEQRIRRLAAVSKYSGILTGSYGPTYLSEINSAASA